MKAFVNTYFKNIDEEETKWECKCGKVLVQRKNTGWTNLVNHIKSQHQDQHKSETQNLKMENFFTNSNTTKKGGNIYGWLHWVCCGLKPFNFVENKLTRMYTKLTPISENTFKKYMTLLTNEVEKKISNMLPPKFALVLDGWTKKSTHYVGVYASYNANKIEGYEMVLLSFSPLLQETSFSARDHYDFLESILNIYGKSLENVVAICGDNAEVNKALANLCNVPLVGCASHRFNLAVLDYLKPYEELIKKVNNLMGKLKGLKMSGILRKFTSLCPVQKNDTRWSSIASMFYRYEQLKCFFIKEELSLQTSLIDLIPNARDNSKITNLLGHLNTFNSVTLALQKEEITIADVRYLHDNLMSTYPTLSKYLSIDSHIVHSPAFEMALVKIQEGQLNELTNVEKDSVSNLKLLASSSNITSDFSVNSENYAYNVLSKRKLERNSYVPSYLDTRFIVPTSNAVERLFSTVGYTFDDLRQKLLPHNLEMQIFLKSNSHLWNEIIVSEIVSSNLE